MSWLVEAFIDSNEEYCKESDNNDQSGKKIYR